MHLDKSRGIPTGSWSNFGRSAHNFVWSNGHKDVPFDFSNSRVFRTPTHTAFHACHAFGGFKVSFATGFTQRI